MNYELVIFDLDGTILDTLEDLTDSINYALAKRGYPTRTIGEVRSFVGNGLLMLARRALAPETDETVIQTVLAEQKAYYKEHCSDKTKPYEGVLPALKILGEKYPIAIVSNKPDTAVKPLCRQYFPGIYARGESADCPRKPAPDMVFKTMAEIGAQSCIYVGDSEVDVLTAKNAGVPCLSVLWGFRNREDMEAVGGCHFCEKTEELVEKIEELTHGQ